MSKLALALLACVLLGLYGGSVGLFAFLWSQAQGKAAETEQHVQGFQGQLGEMERQVAYWKNEAALARQRADEAASNSKASEPADPTPKPPVPTPTPAKRTLLEETTDFYRQVLQSEPENPEVAHETARLFTWSAAVYRRAGNPAKADELYKQGITILDALVKSFPAWPDYRHDLARALMEHGLLIPLLNDPKRSQEMGASWLRAQALQENLVRQVPNVPAYRQELAQMHNDIAGLLQANNNGPAAIERHRQAQALREKLAAEYPTVTDYQSELGATLDNLAFLMAAQGRGPDAQKLCDQAIRHHRAAVKGDPNNPEYRQRYCNHYFLLADVQKRREAYPDMLATLEEMLKDWPESWRAGLQTAEFLGDCMVFLDQESRLAEAKRKERAEIFGKRAVELLRKAYQNKAINADLLRTRPALEPLRARADFKKLLAEAEAAEAQGPRAERHQFGSRVDTEEGS